MPECSILPLRGRLADPSHGECTWLQIGWGIVIFVVNVFFLKIFVTILDVNDVKLFNHEKRNRHKKRPSHIE